MFESKTNLLVGTDSPEIQKMAAHLRAQLLRFRFENLKTANPVAVQGDECLRPRPRDLLRAITSVNAKEERRCKTILDFFEHGQVVSSEPLSPEYSAVLQMLFKTAHERKGEWIRISKLTFGVNEALRVSGERLRLQPRKLGAVLTSLGFTFRKRTNSGWTLLLGGRDWERIHQLVAHYGIEGFGGGEVENKVDSKCSLCKSVGLDKNWPDE
jgi:hypothetical protein